MESGRCDRGSDDQCDFFCISSREKWKEWGKRILLRDDKCFHSSSINCCWWVTWCFGTWCHLLPLVAPSFSQSHGEDCVLSLCWTGSRTLTVPCVLNKSRLISVVRCLRMLSLKKKKKRQLEVLFYLKSQLINVQRVIALCLKLTCEHYASHSQNANTAVIHYIFQPVWWCSIHILQGVL